MNKPLKKSFFASGIILFFGFYFFYPFGLPNVKNYFEPIGERTLQKDEIGQFNYVYNTYEIMDLTGDEFIGGLIMGFNQVGSTSDGCGGNMIQAANNDAQVVLDSDATNGGGGVGTWIKFVCIAPKVWFVSGVVYGVTTSTGADLLQDL